VPDNSCYEKYNGLSLVNAALTRILRWIKKNGITNGSVEKLVATYILKTMHKKSSKF
jgi:hypothetical protein